MNQSHASTTDNKLTFFKKFLPLVFTIAIAIGVSACTPVTLDSVLASGATLLNQDQARAHVSGKTEKWVRHTTYYSPDGKLEVVWNRSPNKGTWEVSADGLVCMNISDWEQDCHVYVNDSGTITTFRNGKNVGVREMVEGRRLRL